MAEGKILVATETFTTEFDGVPIIVHKEKTRVREGHPLLEGREENFKEIDVDYDLEQATAAPGEKRSGKSKRSKSSAD